MKRKLKRTFTSFVAAVILMTTLMSGALFTANAGDARHMYNIYMHPDLSSVNGNTHGKIRTYAISFCTPTDQPAPGTYWSLANFGFTNRDSKDNANKQTYGGYAGFQVFDSFHNKQSAAILSIFQRDEKKTDGTRASCMKLAQKSEACPEATNEPACVHSVEPFNWKGNKWYRMVLHCWDYNDSTNSSNSHNGNTFIGMWIQDIASGKWTLFSYYDTKLKDSVMTGDMHFFMENFAPLEANNARKYRINGIYAKDDTDNSWKSITKAQQEYQGKETAVGYPSFGIDNYYSYFWGNISTESGNPKVNPLAKTRTTQITQTEKPKFGEQKQNEGFKVENNGKQLTVSWSPDITSTPQLSYEIKVYDQYGNCRKTVSKTNPEEFSCTISDFGSLNLKQYSCALTITDIFGHKMTQSYSTPQATKSITISKNPTKTNYFIGDSLSTSGLELNVKYGDGTTKKVTNGFTAYGLDSSTLGANTITVNYGGATTTYKVTVGKPYISITNPQNELFCTDKVALKLAKNPSDGKVTWSSSNNNCASVDQNGNLTAKSSGSATITATLDYNGVKYKSSFTVNVKTTRISWSLSKLKIKPGERLILNTNITVPGAHTVWYELIEEEKGVGKIVCDSYHYYLEAQNKTGKVTVKAKFRYNGQFFETSPIDIFVSNR